MHARMKVPKSVNIKVESFWLRLRSCWLMAARSMTRLTQSSLAATQDADSALTIPPCVTHA
jgi:hypothetical protein